jgi:putative endonuclease
MKAKELGNMGEDRAVEFLINNRHRIIERNWRNRWCEIDIISQKDKVVYFTEVKYRKSNIYGDGFDAITNTKMNQMVFAANNWVSSNQWEGDYRIAVASVSPEQIEFLEL